MNKAVYLLLIGVLNCSVYFANAQCNRQRDSLALEAFYISTNGQDWLNKTNWTLPGRAISTWFGVTLNAEGCVEALRLPNNRLSGGLPPELGDLRELKILNLTSNNISGNIPATITNLSKLEDLNLSTNYFNGWLPANIGNLTNLRTLRLSVNRLSGDIPPSVGNLMQLTSLLLNQNLFSGTIPASVGNLSNLEELVLSQNDLSGTMPPSISNLEKLRSLILSQNMLTGSIPASFANLKALRTLSLDENRLSGSIPSSLGSLSEMREMYLQNNQLTGSIPQELTQLTELQKLLANHNNLSGNIPAGFGNLKKLISLHLSENQLTGSIPPDLGNAANLISLILADNQLSGPIPESLGNLANLDILQIQNNNFSGELPESLGNLTKLRRLYFFNNRFEGCFPNSMQRFCPTAFSTNVNTNGHNFMDNPQLVHGGDFKRWCAGEGRPVVSITGDSVVCEGSTIRLTASGGDFFRWIGPADFTSENATFIIENPVIQQFGTYTVTATNVNKCKTSRNVRVRPVNEVSTGTNAPICEGVALQLFASGGKSYKWFGPDGYYSEEANPVRPVSSQAMAGNYRVEITTEACVITRIIEVRFVSFGQVIADSLVCEGGRLSLDVTEGQSFVWKGPGGFESLLKNPMVENFAPANAGRYSVTIRAGDNCMTTLFFNVELKKKYIPRLDSIPGLCSGADPLLLPLMQDGIEGRWTGMHVRGETGNQIFDPGQATGKQLIFFEPLNAASCIGVGEKEIFISYINIVAEELSASFNDTDDNGNAIIRIESNAGGILLNWEGKASGSHDLGEDKSFEIRQLPSGRYTVNATDKWGCTATDTFEIRYAKAFYFLPNAVMKTASDPENSVFYLKGENILSYSYEIYNRWGNIIAAGYEATANDPVGGWNVQSADITPGVYVYVMKIYGEYEKKQIAGSVTVF